MTELEKYGYSGKTEFEDGAIAARITAQHRERYEVICERGHAAAQLKRTINFIDIPTTGDYVKMIYNPDGESLITELLPRKTLFARTKSWTGMKQAVAANFDYVLIMSSLNADFNPRRLERYLSLALISGAEPIIVMTKLDAAEDAETMLERARAIAKGARVIALSAATGKGLDALGEYLRSGVTLALLGSSGVGKSTLVNYLAGGDIMRVNEIREDDSKGRHTTTYRQLLLMEGGYLLIDTPGMRDLEMWDAEAGVAEVFDDIYALANECKFKDCTHTAEPGCALIAAAKRGEIDPKRLENFRKLVAESRRTAERAEKLARRLKKNNAGKRPHAK